MIDYSLNTSFQYSIRDEYGIRSPCSFYVFNEDIHEPYLDTFNNNIDENNYTQDMTKREENYENKIIKRKKETKEKNGLMEGDLFIDLNQNMISESSNEIKEKKKLGRKRKNERDDKANHSRFSDDNSRRKVKRIIISELHNFINNKIEQKYEGNIGEGQNKKKLMKLCQSFFLFF